MATIDESMFGGSGPIATSIERLSSRLAKLSGLRTDNSTSRLRARLANSSISPGAACSANRLDAAIRSS